MKKQIIALFGSSGRGKTTALKGFIEKLKNNSNFIFKGYVDEYNGTHLDVVALFEYKLGQAVIGISTAGDIRSIIHERVGNCLIKKYNAQIIFTASRTKGETCDELNLLSKNYKYSLSWIEKLYRTHDPINKEIGIQKNKHLDEITNLEINYLLDYLLNYILK